MSIKHMRRQYRELLRELHNVEKEIITLRGEIKWEPKAPAKLFRLHDGAITHRADIEEELYTLNVKIEQQRHLDNVSGEINKVVPFPSVYIREVGSLSA